MKKLRDEYIRAVEPAKALADEAKGLELQIHDLVNEAYGLTPEEVDRIERELLLLQQFKPMQIGTTNDHFEWNVQAIESRIKEYESRRN